MATEFLFGLDLREYTKANSVSGVHTALGGLECTPKEDRDGDGCFLGDFRGVVKNDIYLGRCLIKM
jgi:hypothetical protein